MRNETRDKIRELVKEEIRETMPGSPAAGVLYVISLLVSNHDKVAVRIKGAAGNNLDLAEQAAISAAAYLLDGATGGNPKCLKLP